VDWEFDKATKKKKLKHYSIDFGVCIFCANCIEYCPTNCLSATEEYELATYDRHELNFDNVAMGRLPYKVTNDPMVTPLRELAYLPKGVLDPHGLPAGSRRPGLRPEEIVEQMEPKAEEAAKK
jgi:NAD(P)H-quinone oxidoreductase subunit I